MKELKIFSFEKKELTIKKSRFEENIPFSLFFLSFLLKNIS